MPNQPRVSLVYIRPPGLAAHNHLIFSVAVTPDGKRAISASWDRTLKVWDLASGE
ncbi:MAG: hypothetical protein ACRD2O_16715 [Terriglobia bacterium]